MNPARFFYFYHHFDILQYFPAVIWVMSYIKSRMFNMNEHTLHKLLKSSFLINWKIESVQEARPNNQLHFVP